MSLYDDHYYIRHNYRISNSVLTILIFFVILTHFDLCVNESVLTVVFLAVSRGAIDDMNGGAGIVIGVGIGAIHHSVIKHRI